MAAAVEEPLLVEGGVAGDGGGSSSLPSSVFVEGVVDYKGRRVSRSESGGWRSACFIIGVEIAERFSYYGIASNLITYLTGPLHQSTATAAQNVNIWSGVASMLPLLGAFVADSYLGRFRTIIFASLLYILGLGLLTLSAVLPDFTDPSDITSKSSPSPFKVVFFFSSLYIVALAQGGHKPCVQAFGADQFDGQDPEELKAKSSFFNWWYCALCGGTAISLWILNYIQDNLNWGLGFGIPCGTMALALLIFLLGMKTYRYTFKEDVENPFARISKVFVEAARNWKEKTPPSYADTEKDAGQTSYHAGAHQFKFLEKALITKIDNSDGLQKDLTCSIIQVEEAKSMVRLVPIWLTCLIYAVVFAQSSTFFTKQGSTMDRSVGSNFQIPPAALQSFISISIFLTIPIYDRVFVPIAKRFTGNPSGITMLQRIGFGIFLSLISMVVAALVEAKRLKTALEFGLIDVPQAVVPMSVWWLVPQYVLFGVADVFTMVGLQEFFYDQVPEGLKSMGLSLYLSIFGIGSFISGFMISAIETLTGGNGRNSWFSNNLNRAHLDYFYWFLAGLSFAQLVAYLYFSKKYLYTSGTKL